MMKKFLSLMLSIVFCASVATFFVGCGSKTKIYIDGGAQQGSYNSTPSMVYDAVSNPYPYNTLETLANEWNEKNKSSKYEIVINRNTLNNDRERLVSQLTQKTAPDVLFYLAAGQAEDMNKDWFVDLVPYLNEKNQYVEAGGKGADKWRDIYDEAELEGYVTPRGTIMTIPIDMAPIGIAYNKTLFARAGITEIPETFAEFMEAQRKLKAYATTNNLTDVNPYFPLYTWYDIVIESVIYANKLDKMDTIKVDGRVDTQEFLKYVHKYATPGPNNKFIFGEDEYKQMLTITTKDLTQYYPSGYEGYYAEQEFLNGKVGMVEANSQQMMIISKDTHKDFEVGMFPYPILTNGHTDYTLKNQSDPLLKDGYTANSGGYFVKRGMAGLTSGWGVTNSAVKKGDDAVKACVDFLKYVTAPANNDRMVNDLGFAVPLSGNSTNPLFAPLIEKYIEDSNNEKAIVWGAVNSWGILGKSFLDTYLNNKKKLLAGSSIDVMVDALSSAYVNIELKLLDENGWQKTDWN